MPIWGMGHEPPVRRPAAVGGEAQAGANQVAEAVEVVERACAKTIGEEFPHLSIPR
jgi:hypothetical protein